MSGRIDRYLLPVVLALLTVALGVFIALNTEWADIDVPRPLRGPAATDDLYILQRVLQDVGVSVERHDDLGQLPPTGSPLLLDTWIWGVFPERDSALEKWVRDGGNLIVNGNLLDVRGHAGTGWLPVTREVRRAARPPAPPAPVPQGKPDDAPDAGADEPEGGNHRDTPRAPPAAIPGTGQEDKVPCIEVAEPDGMPATFTEAVDDSGKPRALQLCGFSWREGLRSSQPTVWALRGEGGTNLLRVALGAGSVTALPRAPVFHNRLLLRGDNALIAVAALQATPGGTVWIVAERTRAGLLAWIWDKGAAVVLAGLFALALWLWRIGDRFGPRAPLPVQARRSMVEQIRGTAAFLWQRGPRALHDAQLRALEETARARIRGYGRLDAAGRVAALARAGGLDAAVVAAALNPAAPHAPHQRAQALAVLEGLRRSLLEKARPGQRATHPI